jgi:glycosyltransferase involved in cell wall biosynthesis
MKLSVVMPAYNEQATIRTIVARVLAVDLGSVEKELVIVDDGSKDGTRDILKELDGQNGVRVLFQPHNQGKGAAVWRGILEYDPREYPQLIRPILDGEADVVYGSRFLGSPRGHRVLYFWHSVGNRMLTMLSNMFSDLNLTDMETCYKACRREVIQSILIEEDRFGFEPEFTAKVARSGWRVYEVGISYSGRTYAEGKKIGWRDGLRAFFCIVAYSKVGERFRVKRLSPYFERATR